MMHYNPNDARRGITKYIANTFREINVFLTRKKITDIIQECELKGNWLALNSLLECVYSSRLNLSKSFLEGSDDDNLLEKADCEDSEKSYNYRDGMSVGKYYTVDIQSLRKAYNKLFSLDDINFFTGIKRGIYQLTKSFKRHGYSTYDEDKPYETMNILIILFEIPYLGDMLKFEDILPCICEIVALLPLSARSLLSEVFGKIMKLDNDHDSYFITSDDYDNDKDNDDDDDDSNKNKNDNKLIKLQQTLQQKLTLRLLITESDNNNLNEDREIISTVFVLECVFYGSLLAGKVDSVEHLEYERDYMKTHLLTYHKHSTSSCDDMSSRLSIHPMDCKYPLIPYQDFINETLNNIIDIKHDYMYYKANKDFSFMKYSFLLNTNTKTVHLFFENRLRMRPEFEDRSLLEHLLNPSLKIVVDRDNIVYDTLNALEMTIIQDPDNLKKRLYIEFKNEETVDDGGVSKEFFQLITEQIFNRDYGMFVSNDDNNLLWFNSLTITNMTREYRLLGILLGLAIYNNVILDLNFPPVIYRKLMGKLGTLDDLESIDSVLYNSLKSMLECSKSDLENVYVQTFEIALKDSFGNVVYRELKKNGKSISVTKENRQEFVRLYADYILNESIKEHFNAFYNGFHMVVDVVPMKLLFRPDEIELIVCGSKSFDFKELEKVTKYEGGYTVSSEIIHQFWDIIHNDMSSEDHSKLLKFTTGSDRIPIGGMKNMAFVVMRNGVDSNQLPTAHTCYNTLLLPEYKNRTKMKQLLFKAITYSTGFGIR